MYGQVNGCYDGGDDDDTYGGYHDDKMMLMTRMPACSVLSSVSQLSRSVTMSIQILNSHE